MTMIVRAFAMVAFALLAACTTVSTTNPIGIGNGAVTDAKLMGSWKFIPAESDSKDKDEAYAFLMEKEGGGLRGLLVIASENEWWEADIVLGKAGANGMLNMRPVLKNGEALEDKDKIDGYFPFRYAAGADGSIALYTWDEDGLKKAVEDGRIKGTATSSAITLTADPKTLDAFFAKEAPALFPKPWATMQRIVK